MAVGRRLAAIMFTDMVGFTALTQRDEAAALHLLQRHHQVLRPFFRRFRGREIKTIGDSFLVEFDSALDATNCAIEIQRSLHESEDSTPAAERFHLRIGIHLGDVVHTKSDVLGDAVNIASRIEPLAPPGGICLSEQVFDQVHNKLVAPLLELGPHDLKNVDFPTAIYRVILPWELPGSAAPKVANRLRQRLAVLPFANLSPDPNDGFFADGLTEEILTELARLPGLRVIARTSVMRYRGTTKTVEEVGRELQIGTVLEGSVRKAGNRIRVTTQLIDTGSQEHLWAERFDRDFTDIFEIQTDIARHVAEALGVRLQGAALEERTPTQNMEAYTAYLRARALWNRRSSLSVREALKLFQEASRLDPKFALPHTGIADCYSILLDRNELPWSEVGPKALVSAQSAIELAPNLAEAHASLGLALSHHYRWDEAGRELRRAIDLAPGYAMGHHWLYLHLVTMGRYDEAGAEIARAEEVDPLSSIVLFNAGNYLGFRGRIDDAVTKWSRAIELGTGLADWIYVAKGLLLAGEGQTAEAAAARQDLQAMIDRGEVSAATDRIWLPALLDAALGRKDRARAGLAALLPLVPTGEVMAGEIATLYGALDDLDPFFEWLDRAIAEHSFSPANLRLSPALQRARRDPRFAVALRAMGLSP